MLITLTQEDIDRGTPSSHTHCAFCFAIKRTLGEHEVFVYRDYCTIKNMRFDFPPDIKVKMTDYDLENKISPMSFNLIENHE